MAHNIKILHFNAQGIKGKIDIIKQLIIKNDPDIISLQETFLQDKDSKVNLAIIEAKNLKILPNHGGFS